MNTYKITRIDPETNAVYATFVYGDHVLDHREIVKDVNDSKLITQIIEQAFKGFASDMDVIDKKPKQLEASVAALIDVEVAVALDIQGDVISEPPIKL